MSADHLPQAAPALRRWRRWSYGPHGRLSDYWRAELAKDPLSRNLVLTMELVFGEDVVVRVATRPVRVVSGNDGAAYAYTPDLVEEPEVAREYALGDPASSAASVQFSVPNRLVDAAQVVARGRFLCGFGEVCLQVDGGDWDERVVLLRGDMDDGVTFGDTGAGVVAGSLTDPKGVVDLAIPPWEVDTDDGWTQADESAVGQRYPIVVNRYEDVPAIPVRTGATQYWLVAYGHGWTIDTSTGVKVDGTAYASGSGEFAWAEVETTDGYGVPVTVIQFTGTHSWTYSESVHVTVTGGRGATDLVGAVQYLVEHFSALGKAGVNTALFASAKAKLGELAVRVLVNGSGTSSSATALSFIEGGLLAAFPMVSMAWEGGGYGPVVTDRRDPLVAVDLTVGAYPLLDRVSDVQETPKSAVYNSFAVRYAYDVVEDTYTRVAIRNPRNTTLCQVSRDQSGERPMDVIETPYVYDEAVAEYVADWLVEHRTLPSYYVEYAAYPWVLFYLRRGDNVRITDPDFSWTQVVATVERLTYARGACVLGLRVWAAYYAVGGGSSTGTASPSGVT